MRKSRVRKSKKSHSDHYQSRLRRKMPLLAWVDRDVAEQLRNLSEAAIRLGFTGLTTAAITRAMMTALTQSGLPIHLFPDEQDLAYCLAEMLTEGWPAAKRPLSEIAPVPQIRNLHPEIPLEARGYLRASQAFSDLITPDGFPMRIFGEDDVLVETAFRAFRADIDGGTPQYEYRYWSARKDYDPYEFQGSLPHEAVDALEVAPGVASSFLRDRADKGKSVTDRADAWRKAHAEDGEEGQVAA